MDVNALNYDDSAKKEDGSCEFTPFDKGALLTNITENYILPSIQEYKSKIESLDNSINNFTSNPSEENLENVRTEWRNALLTWQDISFINIGVADYSYLINNTNQFPADTTSIDESISSGAWNFDNAQFNSSKGFPALDYLLYKRGLTNSEILTNLSMENAKNYLTAISDDLLQNSIEIHDDWVSKKSEFINNNATDLSGNESSSTGESVSVIINKFCEHYEFWVRRGKLGLPLGKFNQFSGQEMPHLVECYHYGQSLPFLIRSVESIKKYINGFNYTTGIDGPGFDDYMNFVEASFVNSTTSESENLSVAINNQFDEIISKLNALNDPLSVEVVSNKSAVEEAYEPMQDLVPKIKVDMTSALGVLITYADNDGD